LVPTPKSNLICKIDIEEEVGVLGPAP